MALDDPSVAVERAAGGLPTAAFGAVLRRLRSAASLSQEELAERAGLSRRGISDLERGVRRAPWPQTVRMLAEALAVDERDRAALLTAARPPALKGALSAQVRFTPAALPSPLTRLIGREQEVVSLRSQLRREDDRLVTIVGPGGVGKTRLAIAVADGMQDVFPDGIVFVDCSPLTEPNLAVPTIATALRVHDMAHQPLLVAVGDFLATKRLLLIVDNCERVLEAGRDIARLLAASPGLTVLATSREPFHIQGERQFSLPPLPLPDPDGRLGVDMVRHVPAVQLFVERAQAVQPDFALTTDNVSAVAAICRRLDGLPLAIELAAARVKALPPVTLLTRLDPRLPLLTGGGHDLPARQRTMRGTIAWSYDLLAPDEQALFCCLAVFAGGFTLPAAEAVAGPGSMTMVLNGVTALIERSLLRRIPGSDETPRYRMLETVREFGLEQFPVAGDAEKAHLRHAAYFLQLADDLVHATPFLMNLKSLALVAAEQANVRAALRWFDERGEIEAVLQLSSLLTGLWFARGLYHEGRQVVERALAQSRGVASAARVRALACAGMLARFHGDYGRARSLLDEGLALARGIDDALLVGEALTSAGALALRRGDYTQAEQLATEAIGRLHQPDGHPAEALPVCGLALLVLGTSDLMQEQFDSAAIRVQEAIDHFDRAGSAWGLSDAQAGLAAIRYCSGDIRAAASLYGESLTRAHDLNIASLFASDLIGLAAVAAAVGQTETGARLLGAAEDSAASLGAPIFTRDLPVRERAVAALVQAFGSEQLAALREAGRVLGPDAAIAEAHAVAEAVIGSRPA